MLTILANSKEVHISKRYAKRELGYGRPVYAVDPDGTKYRVTRITGDYAYDLQGKAHEINVYMFCL